MPLVAFSRGAYVFALPSEYSGAVNSETMRDTLSRWLLDPVVGKIVIVLIGLLSLVVLVRLGHRSLDRYVRDANVRYRARKGVSFLGYVAAVLFLTVVFRNQLGGVTVG